MISTLISIFTAGTLMTQDLPSINPHIISWNENMLIESVSGPKKNEKNIAPVIEAKAAIVVDMKNGLILYEKNIHQPLYIASLTKLMTALIVLEENDPSEVVTVSENASKTPGKKIWLAPDEKITVENLLYASLIESANDAATALAEYNAGSAESFVIKMNRKAEELGLRSTTFVNPTGLDEGEDNGTFQSTIEDGNISSVYDLTLLGKYVYGKSFIRRTVTKKELEIASTNERLIHKLKNTNALLDSYLTILGLKTGTTDNAGECLIAIIENEKGNDILTVVLGSPARYNETKILADWTLRTYKW
ncbi:D-alanyl-D-alanine carboxypeptidase [Patescibacteria group bacterium]|nr:D-alanyl-D-alanine carboxypeptidase [Patescibacteria group bacterium]MBU1703676.1 D-alanyl-D-alanine carboxypeptidase [Patescibacteria group bacterium]MBU1953943.1 D-alanyl-D-alanine carboxypeptidase [Patescibacteria group bacterium]